MRTYQGRLQIDAKSTRVLNAYTALYGKVERTLFAETLAQSVRPESVKAAYLKRFGITARQFNAICRNLKGKVASIKERRKGLVDEAKTRIAKARQQVEKLERQIKRAPHAVDIAQRRQRLHQKKRRLAILEARQANRIADHQSGRVRLCFGSKRLFHAQHHLEANGFADHEAWRAAWHQARNNQFYVIGSKDETAGCQGCVATPTDDGFLLRLRLPDAHVGSDKYLSIPVRIPYGDDVIRKALKTKQAISYRFLRDAKGWRVFVSTEAPAKPETTRRALGAIGLDVNADHLALAELNRHGNPVAVRSFPLVTRGLSGDQAKALVGDTVKEMIAHIAPTGKPLVVEQLDFARKKSQLEGEDKARARGLSSFAYRAVLTALKARAQDAGIEIIEINPVYTSVIGTAKFAHRYGFSTHQGAAVAIARRGLRFSERPNRRDQLASCLPARNRHKHVWSFWRQVARKTAAHAARYPSAISRSHPPSNQDAGGDHTDIYRRDSGTRAGSTVRPAA